MTEQTAKKAPSPLRGEGWGGGDSLLHNAKNLRKNLTDAEQKFWHAIRRKQLGGHKFRRQHAMGNKYVVDFICLEKKLIIELDGGQHAEKKSYDAKRTAFLEKEGYRVLRFWNNEVIENMEGVLQVIMGALHTPVRMCDTPTPTLPPQGGGGKEGAIYD